MKAHTTNYFDTFIEVAEDCSSYNGLIPTSKQGQKSVAEMQYELISENPYKYDSDDILFLVYVLRNDIINSEYEQARKTFFSKGQACFRASPLTKRYGFGVHANQEGKIAIYGRETPEYEEFMHNPQIKKVKAMRTKRAL